MEIKFGCSKYGNFPPVAIAFPPELRAGSPGLAARKNPANPGWNANPALAIRVGRIIISVS
jgi:hypothetical protein